MARIILDQKNPDGEERAGALVEFPFNQMIVDALKELAPGKDRRWVPYAKQWWVAAEYVDRAADLLLEHFAEIEIVDADGEVTYRDRGGSAAQSEFFR